MPAFVAAFCAALLLGSSALAGSLEPVEGSIRPRHEREMAQLRQQCAFERQLQVRAAQMRADVAHDLELEQSRQQLALPQQLQAQLAQLRESMALGEAFRPIGRAGYTPPPTACADPPERGDGDRNRCP